jgi:tight adherence protein C
MPLRAASGSLVAKVRATFGSRLGRGAALGAATGLGLGALAWLGGASPAWALSTVAAAAGLPVLRAWERRAARRRALLRALPFHLELLTLAGEAGLELGAALQAVLERGRPGPLHDELRRTAASLKLGRTRAEALAELAGQVDLAEVHALVGAILQADRLGQGLARALRIQAAELRRLRFEQAEARAAEAAVALLVPLTLFVFPASFVVLAAPLLLAQLVGPLAPGRGRDRADDRSRGPSGRPICYAAWAVLAGPMTRAHPGRA